MTRPAVAATRIGREGQPVVTVDAFHADPDALRRFATDAAFEAGRHHYPGVRAALPPDYLQAFGAVVVPIVQQAFGYREHIELIDASFSIVSTPPYALSVEQRLPHFDSLAPGRIAFVHYLSPEGGDGTAFFRHRTTGFETLSEARAPTYFERLNADIRTEGLPPPAYIRDSNALFERIAGVDARYNRAVLYRSALLHSGAIAPDAALDPSPATGRLTVTAFLSAR